VTSPWAISADDIEHWADRADAPAVLPKLVRRLLFATTPLDALDVRADAGIRFGDWDGIVRAREGSTFCPPGSSLWEFSVASDVRRKLRDDFEKRATEPARGDIRSAVYVAVVARRFAQKRALAGAQRKRGVFADVVIYDADDLATWLEQAPAVGAWFAQEHLGRPADAIDVETFAKEWSARTRPPLPYDLVLTGRDREARAADLRQWLGAPKALPLFVQADSQEEAVLFVAATVLGAPERDAWIPRVIIARTSETYTWSLRAEGAERSIVLPMFDGADPAPADRSPARLLFPIDRATSSPSRQTLRLDPLPHRPLVQRLRDAGLGEREAEQEVQQSDGVLASLQRLRGYVRPPPWAKAGVRPELVAFLLAGGWTPTNPSDRDALQRLDGEPASVERLCADLYPAEVDQERGRWRSPAWKWRAPLDAWNALAHSLDVVQSWRQPFYDVACSVLGEVDPRLELTPNERFVAPLLGKTIRFSNVLREGLAQSLVLVAVTDGIHDGERLASRVVRDVLASERGWTVWASIDRLLPSLAEAAPDAFLQAVERSLDGGDGGIAHLFVEETGGLGTTFHTGLLWALELLAWSPSFPIVQRTILAVARWAETDRDSDKQGKVINRPARSLAEMLDFRIPKSHTTAAERLGVLRLILELHPDVGWHLLLKAFYALGMPRMVMSPLTPRFRDWGPSGRFQDEALGADQEMQLKAMIDLSVGYAAHDAARWAALLEPARHLPDPWEQEVLDALEARAPAIDDAKGSLWDSLRTQLSRAYSDGRRSGEMRRACLDRLYRRFTPNDLVHRHAPLFARGYQLPERVESDGVKEWEVRTQRIEELASEAVAEVWKQPDGWSLLESLAKVIELPDALADALAKAAFAHELEDRLLDNAYDGPMNRVTARFLARRAFAHGFAEGDGTWLDEKLRRLVAGGRVDMAAQATALLPATPKFWDRLEATGEPLWSAYWKAVALIGRDFSPEQLDRAIRQLLRVRREELAIDTASYAKETLSPATAMEVIRQATRRLVELQSAGTPPPRFNDYAITGVFEAADRDSAMSDAEMGLLEIPFLSYLDPYGRGSSRTLRLGRALGSDPSLFVRMVSFMYRAKDDTRTESPTQDEQNVAHNALRILEAWNGYPGEDLPEEEREHAVETWCLEVIKEASQNGRGEIVLSPLGKVLARVPPASDEHWPCVAARCLLESGSYPDLAGYIAIAERNRRGATVRAIGEGGGQERELAERYRTFADALRDEFSRTAVMLDGLARSYTADAEEEDASARRDRIEYGERPEAAAPIVEESPTESTAEPSGPIARLETHHVGPSPSLVVEFEPGLNLLTGDNSLGKTFVLDVLFWAMSGTWPGARSVARPGPRHGRKRPTTARGQIAARAKSASEAPRIVATPASGLAVTGTFDATNDRWTTGGSTRGYRNLVVYARVDGGFSVWDPLRNHASNTAHGVDISSGYDFSSDTLWEGLNGAVGAAPLCNGLIRDVVGWRSERRDAYDALTKALGTLSPPDEPIALGLPRKLSIDDARLHPTLQLSYDDVYAVHASASVKRVLGLAYVLVWAITESRDAASLAGTEPVRNVALLIDEIEAHLHPRWQRAILKAVMGVVRELAPTADVQVMITTHSPLVLAAAEDEFDPANDALVHFDLPRSTKGRRSVAIERIPWTKVGEANAWLTSKAMALSSTYSPDTEAVLERARKALQSPKTAVATARAIHEDLRKKLSELDPFWARWRYIAEKRGWIP